MAQFVVGRGQYDQVNPQLLEILRAAAGAWDGGTKVELISGSRGNGASQHGHNRAVDIQLYDRNGRPLPNLADARSFRAYEGFAQAAKAYQATKYPGLDDKFTWGGYWGPTELNQIHEPQTTAGRYASTIGEFLPGALMGPGSLIPRLAKFGAIPGAVSEAAGQMTEGTPAEGPARFAGAMLPGGIAGALSRPSTPAQALRQRMPRNATEQDITRAEQAIQQAQQQGVNVTWPEALHYVTNGRVDLTDVQRILEQSRGGRPRMAEIMAERPGQAERAVATGIEGLARQPAQAGLVPRAQQGAQPPTYPEADPYRRGLQVQDLSDRALTQIRQRINAATDPLYRAAAPQTVDPRTFQQLSGDGLFQQGLRAVRGDPAHSRFIQGLPDNSVGVLNEVKKYLDDLAGRAATAGENQRASVYSRAAEDVRGAGTSTSPEYRMALDAQTRMRREVLNPREAGPTGQMAATSDLGRQGAALMPRQQERIVPGMENQVGHTVRQLVRADPAAATQVVTNYLKQVADEALSANPNGLNQWGGAAFAASIRGSSQQARNLRAVIANLPDGATKQGPFQSLMLTLEATGRRQRPGSQTQPNMALTDAMKRGGPVGTTASLATSPGSAVTYLRNAYEEFRLGRNTEQLAFILTDPGAGRLLRSITQARTGADRERIVATLLFMADRAIHGQDGPETGPSFAPLQ